MAVIIETPNPFEPFVGMKKHTHPGGISIWEWLRLTYPGFTEFGNPTICLVNGQPTLRSDWDRKIEDRDIINFIAVVGEVATIIIAVIVIIAAIALSLTMQVPVTPGEVPASDPVFSIKGQQNSIRLGEPIEVNYGRNRIYPSYASRPFFLYQNNDQFQHSLFCIGQGEYEISAIQIGDTVISSYQEAEWEVLPPGAPATLFKTNIYTAPEVGGQMLFGPNNPEYIDDGWVGPFPVCPSGKEVTDIDVDLVYPKGIYNMTNNRGDLEEESVTTEFQARLIDDVGAPLGDWFTLFNPVEVGMTTTPQRRTYSSPEGIGSTIFQTYIHWRESDVAKMVTTIAHGFNVGDHVRVSRCHNDSFNIEDAEILEVPHPQTFTYANPGPDLNPDPPLFGEYDPYGRVQKLSGIVGGLPVGRYEVRARRTSERIDTNRYGYDVVWEGMRGYISGDEPDFGEVTLLAVKIRATNNLNSNTQKLFNVIATRKLPILGSDGFSAPIATRSIVWAFVDIFRSAYGGRITDDKFLDLDTLETLDAFFEDRNEHFDWTFRDAITLWEAAKAVAVVGRSIPLLVGSLITMRRDGPLELPVAMFIPDNMAKGSFNWDIKLWEPDEYDSISIEYTEPSTGYKQEQVPCILPGGTYDRPENIRLSGVQDRTHAYRQGLYILASKRYLRENISFETGMEGFLPSYGDLIAIVHDVPRWGQSGFIVAVEDLGSDQFALYVSEPLLFDESNEFQILLRGKQGELIGPISAEETSDPRVVIVTLVSAPDFLTSGRTEPMLFLFGVAGQITKYGRVVKIEPQGGERVKITAMNEAPIVHSFDSLEPPPLASIGLPPEVPDLPVIPGLFLSQVNAVVLTIQASWLAAFGAQSYLVQTSTDGENWQQRAETARTSIQLQVGAGLIYVRVAAINQGQGPWIQSSITVGRIFGLEVDVPWVDLEWGVRWWNNVLVSKYQVRVYDISGSEPVLKRTTQQDGTTFLYTYEMAVADSNLSREMRVEVDGMYIDDDTGDLVADGTPIGLDLLNPLPAPPAESSIGYEFVSFNPTTHVVTYHLFWVDPIEGDLIRVRVWLSDIDGFDYTALSPVYDYTSSSPGSAYVPVEIDVEVELDADNVHPDWYWRIAVDDVWGSEGAVTEQETIAPAWILEDAEWADEGRWRDGDTWNDS